MRRHTQQPVEAAEGAREGLLLVVGHRDEHDAGEGASEFGELALLPVTAMIGDGAGESADESGTIVADDSEHEVGHAASLTLRLRRVRALLRDATPDAMTSSRIGCGYGERVNGLGTITIAEQSPEMNCARRDVRCKRPAFSLPRGIATPYGDRDGLGVIEFHFR